MFSPFKGTNKQNELNKGTGIIKIKRTINKLKSVHMHFNAEISGLYIKGVHTYFFFYRRLRQSKKFCFSPRFLLIMFGVHLILLNLDKIKRLSTPFSLLLSNAVQIETILLFQGQLILYKFLRNTVAIVSVHLHTRSQ